MTISPHDIGSSTAVPPSATVNRARLRAAVDAAQIAGQAVCVVHIDLDRFHQINRRWGQQLGDLVLGSVSDALGMALPARSLLAPIEGDTFVAMVPSADASAARDAAEALLAAVRQPLVVGGVALTIEASAGYAQHMPGDAANDLLEQAFLACRRAKATRRGSVFGYEVSPSLDAVERLCSDDALRAAVAHDELRLHTQPIVDLRDGRVIGVEALVRWQHPIEGLLAPAEFLPAADSAGLTIAIGDWVLAEAIRLVGHWRAARGCGPLRIWVNLAAQQLADGDHLFQQVSDAMHAGLISAHDIGFEVTESSLLVDMPSAVGTLSALRGLGVEIALDDFGTGYSSLTYLQQLPVTAVKIDRSFVAGIGGSLADEAIIEAVIDLAHALGLRVVAEGIEDSAQAEALIRMGADEAQGFHFSYPSDAAQVATILDLPWCGVTPPAAAVDRPLDRRADELPGFGSARARLLLRALDTVHDSIIVTSAAPSSTGIPPIVYVNPAFEAETGFAAADIVGQTIETLFADAADGETLAWFHSVHVGATAATREVASRRADGSTYLCEVTLSPILDERSIHTHWLHVRSDLTARRAEANDRARFQGLIEQSSSLVAIAESGGGWLYANRALRAALGVGPHEPLDDISGCMRFGEARQHLEDSDVIPELRATGRWSGAMAVINQATGESTETITDVNVVEDELRPGVKVYASVSRDMTEINALEQVERRRRDLFGFASELAQRALAKGRDELFKDFDSVLAECGRLLGADFAYVDTIDLDEGLLRPLGSWHSDRCPPKDVEPGPVDVALLPTWIERLGHRGVLMGGSIANPTPWRTELTAVFGGPNFESYVYCGLNVGGVLVGAFGLARPHPDPAWSDDELATVQQIADTIANLLGRERADRARLVGERHVNAMLSNVRDILVVVDREGTVRYANPQIEVATGHPAAEVVGQHFLRLIHPDDAAMAVERFRETIAGVSLLPVTELRIVLADGSAQWYDIDSSGVEDPVLGGYVVSMRNVSGQHAQAAVADRHRELEHVLLNLSHWALNVEYEHVETGLTEHLGNLGHVLHTDAAGVWLFDGPVLRTAAQWAIPRADGVVPTITGFEAPTLTERARTRHFVFAVDDIEEHDEPWAREWRRIPGCARSALVVPLVSAGRTFGVVGVTMMDTPRAWAEEEHALVGRVADTVAALLARQSVEASLRASEARLTALLDGSLDLVVVVGNDGEMLYANRTARRTLGYVSDEIIGSNIADVVHADDLDLAIAELQALSTGSATEPTTLRVIARDGTVRWIEIMSGLVRDPIAGGKVLTCRDVTERHAAEIDATTRVGHLRYAFEIAQAALDLDADEFLATLPGVCETINEMLDADFVYVDRIDEQQELLTNLAGCVRNGAVQVVQPGETLAFHRLPLWIERLRRLDPVVTNDVSTATEPWAAEKRDVMGCADGALVAIAMSGAGELFGVLGVAMVDTSRVWTDDEMTFLRIIGETIAHVLERARVDDALRRSETRFRLLSETAADVVLLIDADGAIQYASPSSLGLLGCTPADLFGRAVRSLVHPDDIEVLSAVSEAQLQPGAPLTSECRLVRADGDYVWVANSISAVLDPATGRAVEYRASLRDITELKRLEAALEEQALRDPLTGLGNRILLHSRLSSATTTKSSPPSEVSVLLIDLDGFKLINDTYGHAVGDDALRIVAARLEGLTRTKDTLARTGGDEFVVICPGTTTDEAVRIGERIVNAVREPLTINGMVVHLGASVGVAHHIGCTTDPGWLLIEADHAMYAAKREGRGRVRVADAQHPATRSCVALET